MRRFVDTSVFADVFGEPQPNKQACLALIAAAQCGDVELHASVEMIQELVFHRMRRVDRITAIAQAHDAQELCVLHPFGLDVLNQALKLTATTRTGGRDAVHAATALLAGFDAIVSPERDFGDIPGPRRLDPADALASPC